MAPSRPLIALLALLLALPAMARELRPSVERLPNGLTVMILEDHTQPVVSTQVLYRVGGRTESPGETGLAHFVEHMAYRATESFPDTEVVGRIYAAGGEWHGYTWIDETTYFETLPAARLELALAIQADRMARLQIPAGEVEAERGAVLTELHGYENAPASRLNDAVLATSFLQHPYRNNVIGAETDVRSITRSELVAFYRLHYQPANAVLAVVGDVDHARVLELVHRHFGPIAGGSPTALPRAVEPPQLGERRIDLQGGGGRAWFQIAYRAPAARDPDYPAFLLLQAVLSGSGGANFRQDDEPFAAAPGTRLHGIGHGVREIRTFLAPTGQPYVFSLSGSLIDKTEPGAAPERIEAEIERRIAVLRERPVPAGELEAARRNLLDALDLDCETTEDAAHQMSYYEGIGAFEVLRRLPELVAAVTAEDLRRVAVSRLQPWQRTIGWVHPGAPLSVPSGPSTALGTAAATPQPSPGPRAASLATPEAPRSAPAVRKLRNGVGVIVRRLPRVPAGVLRVVVPGDALAFADAAFTVTPDEPSWRFTSLQIPFRAGHLGEAVEQARLALDRATAADQLPAEAPEDPEALLRLILRGLLRASPTRFQGRLTPAVIVAVGDLDEAAALRLAEKAFGGLPACRPLPPAALRIDKRAQSVALPGRAQSELGYAVPAAGTSSPDADAWRILLYVMSHGYEGRLGKELIGRLGLLYSIDSRYDSDGQAGWISLVTGVDPEKLDATRERFAGLLDRLRREPPTEAEVAEAKEHLIGRRVTAPLSNEEISAAYAREWIELGRLATDEEHARRVRAVPRARVLALVPRFLAGVTAVVDVRAPEVRP